MNLSHHIDSPLYRTIQQEAARLGVEVYVIGGFVRDILLDRPNTDIDLVANTKGLELAQACAKALGIKKVDIFKTYGTAHFRYKQLDIEFVNARKESYSRESRKPDVEQGTLEDDQNRRDFTINALAISLQAHNFGEVIDPFNGLADLENKILRTPLDPDITYSMILCA